MVNEYFGRTNKTNKPNSTTVLERNAVELKKEGKKPELHL